MLVRGFRIQHQAEAAAEAQKEVLNEVFDSTLATKADLKEVEATIVKWIAGLMIGQTAALIALLKLLK